MRRLLLAVDDNRLILEVIDGFFTRQNWDVRTAESVPAARLALSIDRPDVIVSDIIMPGTDGWTFFEEVRQREATASVPFVFLTVEHALPQRLRGLKLGADDYMTKPFAVEELHARIERLLDRNAALQRAGHQDDGALLAGSVEHLSIADLLQILALNGKSGTVRLQRGDDVGRIEFQQGRIVDASTGSVGGTKALFRMLSWENTTFRVVSRAGDAPTPTIRLATATVLMEGLLSVDEWFHRQAALPERETRLTLSRGALNLLKGLALTPAQLDLVARAKDGITVARAIEESSHPDGSVAEAICTMLAQGVLKATSEGKKAPAASG